MKWLPSLFAAEAIPSAVVTFVALLMFVQLGEGWGKSTLLCGLLTLPWVLKSFLREKVRRHGHFAHVLRLIEVCLFFSLVALAFSFNISKYRVGHIYGILFLICFFCAWHELAARMYYERMLRPREQRLYNAPKMFFSQCFVIITYGVMLLVVGGLEIFYHNRHQAVALSWSTSIYLLAGIYLLLLIYNLFTLKPAHVGDRSQTQTIGGAVRAEVRTIDRIIHQPHWLLVVVCLFFMLLPQALLFHSRVLFLYASPAEGGLGCSLQWIALAQGTVGVLAFSLGLGYGYRLERRHQVFSTIPTACVTLVLSPFVYWLMTQWPPQSLWLLCMATFVAQISFGFGLNACIPYVRYISGERYRSTINYLYIPLVALVMLIPFSVSGWLVDYLGFPHYFAVDSFMAVPALIAGRLGTMKIKNNKSI